MADAMDKEELLDQGQRALRDHARKLAARARQRHGDVTTLAGLRRLLGDSDVVRFPTELVFDAGPLLPGEFAWAMPLGARPDDGFALVVHPELENDPEAVALAVAYHLVRVNYLDVAGAPEAEIFGATLLGLEVDDYYERLCALADRLAPASCAPAACR